MTHPVSLNWRECAILARDVCVKDVGCRNLMRRSRPRALGHPDIQTCLVRDLTAFSSLPNNT